MEDSAGRCGLSAEMSGVWSSNHDSPQIGREKYQGFAEKQLVKGVKMCYHKHS